MGPPKVSVSSNLGAFGLVLGQKLKLVAPCKKMEVYLIHTYIHYHAPRVQQPIPKLKIQIF